MRFWLYLILLWTFVGWNGKMFAQTINIPTQIGSGNTQNMDFSPVHFHFVIKIYNYNVNGENHPLTIPIDTILNGVEREIQQIVSNMGVSFSSTEILMNDTINRNIDDKYIFSVNKTQTEGIDIMTTMIDSTSVQTFDSISIHVTYVPKLETDEFIYAGECIVPNMEEQKKSNKDNKMQKKVGMVTKYVLNGKGKMTIKKDNYRLCDNSCITANSGDIIIGEFKNGQITNYTQLNSNGDPLRVGHVPSKYDIMFKIDSSDMKRGPLLNNKHIDITIGDLLAKFNGFDNKKVSANDFESFRNVSTEKMLKRLEAFWNTVSMFSYDAKKFNGRIYNIRSDSKGFFVEMPVNNRRRIDTIKRKDLLLKIYFNSEWQMSDLNYNFISDIEFDDNVDSLTRYVIADLIEEFRLSYGKKDIDYITAKFDKDATIIVGQKYYNKKTRYRKYRADDAKDNCDRYLINLTGTFGRNRKIQLKFEKIRVKKIDGTINKYYILLYQHWNATLYSDEGWLQMLWRVDTKTGNAIIYMREWSDDGNFTEDPNNYIINK